MVAALYSIHQSDQLNSSYLSIQSNNQIEVSYDDHHLPTIHHPTRPLLHPCALGHGFLTLHAMSSSLQFCLSQLYARIRYVPFLRIIGTS
jgi:hypothetical protein